MPAVMPKREEVRERIWLRIWLCGALLAAGIRIWFYVVNLCGCGEGTGRGMGLRRSTDASVVLDAVCDDGVEGEGVLLVVHAGCELGEGV